MTHENKQFLLEDLCARLPYGVKFQGEDSNVYTLDAANYFAIQVEDVVFKPYLRPMSSMTEEEQRYIWNKYGSSPLFADFEDVGDVSELFKYCHMNIGDANLFVDWLNSHHFDYRGLIPMGLALEAPNNMYKN